MKNTDPTWRKWGKSDWFRKDGAQFELSLWRKVTWTYPTRLVLAHVPYLPPERQCPCDPELDWDNPIVLWRTKIDDSFDGIDEVYDQIMAIVDAEVMNDADRRIRMSSFDVFASYDEF